jgi:3-oxoadipate enol-lactonase
MTLYEDSFRLRLEAGHEVEAFVRRGPGGVDRPKCLLLHGNPGSLLDWAELAPLLFDTWDVAAIDLPGFGRTARFALAPESLGLDSLVDCVVAVANALGWRQPIFLFGHSHGGGVAQRAAAQHPDRIAGLALFGTLGAPAHGSYRLLSTPGAATVARLAGRTLRSGRLPRLSGFVVERVMAPIFFPETVPREKLEQEVALFASRPEILESMVHVALGRPCAQLFESASGIRCPTLIIHGQEDALVPAKHASTIHERILGGGGCSRLHLLPNAGHMLIRYQAAQLAALVDRTFETSVNEVGERRGAELGGG